MRNMRIQDSMKTLPMLSGSGALKLHTRGVHKPCRFKVFMASILEKLNHYSANCLEARVFEGDFYTSLRLHLSTRFHLNSDYMLFATLSEDLALR